jgi:hypothetical protein
VELLPPWKVYRFIFKIASQRRVFFTVEHCITARERTNIEPRRGGYLASPLVVAVPLKH